MELKGQSTSYVVKTANGYVGRMNLDGDLTDTMRYDFAYCYSRDEAERVAERFNGEAVPTR